jgi:uncharacterized membrane protein YphA (DoxX/SURF4 family)
MQTVVKHLISTANIPAAIVLRLILGSVLFAHGAKDMLGWFGTNPGEGNAYHLLVIGISGTLIMMGGGAWSLDRKLARFLK